MSQPKLTKTINDYREILSEEIDNVRNDKCTPAKINAITNAVGKVLSTVKLEMEYAKLSGKKPNILMLKANDE
jgi:hypothetical protein